MLPISSKFCNVVEMTSSFRPDSVSSPISLLHVISVFQGLGCWRMMKPQRGVLEVICGEWEYPLRHQVDARHMVIILNSALGWGGVGAYLEIH